MELRIIILVLSESREIGFKIFFVFFLIPTAFYFTMIDKTVPFRLSLHKEKDHPIRMVFNKDKTPGITRGYCIIRHRASFPLVAV